MFSSIKFHRHLRLRKSFKLFSISEAEVATKKAQQAQKTKQWDICKDESTIALQTATHSTTLRTMRANCALESGDVEQSVADLT